MKRRWWTAAAMVLWCGPSLRADEIANNIEAHLNNTALDALAQDVGTLMGGGSFHSGKALGFPVGFDLGVHVPLVRVQDDNPIFQDDETTIGAGWIQAEIGLPANINVIARGGRLGDADLLGGGLRFGVLNNSSPGLPSVSISALYGELKHDFVKAKTVSANLVMSFDVPFIHPYIGGGYDVTTLDPTDRAFQGAPAGVSTSVDGEADGYRAEVGVNISIIPFTYITAAGGIANGETLYHAGVGGGVRF